MIEVLGGRGWPHSIYYAIPMVWDCDPVAVERELRSGYETLGRMGEKSHFTSLTTGLAQAVYAQGRLDEAEELIQEATAASRPNDVQCRTITRTVQAKVLAQRGDLVAAEDLAREAIAFVEQSDFIPVRAEALLDLAEILRLAARPDEAAEAVAESMHLYEQTGRVASATKARRLLNELRTAKGA